MSPEGLAGYRLVEPIGRGASATVFSAEYGKLRRPVAIKILHRHLHDGSAHRMLAEARTLSMLDHPGIVRVFDVGTTHDGRTFMVMEQLFGEPLHERLRKGRLAEDRVRMFGCQLASALEVAHGAGIVHRDLKPENVFVVQDPDVSGGERVKLIDFGIAKHVEHTLTGVERTATGIVLGTPAYMAPERFSDGRTTDVRADVYSLGVVIYVMATGEQPFDGRDTNELAAEHAYCRPRPPTVTGVSRGLSDVIERCLAKRPEDRYASMAAVGAALRSCEPTNQFDDVTTFVWGTRRFQSSMEPVISPPRLARASSSPPLPPKLARPSSAALAQFPVPALPRVRSLLVFGIAIALALLLAIDVRSTTRLERVAVRHALRAASAIQEPPPDPTVQTRSSKTKRPKKRAIAKKRGGLPTPAAIRRATGG